MKCRTALAAALVCALAIVPLAGLSGCLPPPAADRTLVTSGPPQKAETEADPGDRLVAAINDFGATLVESMSQGSGHNAIVSPASVHSVLSMTANGATDETSSEMRQVLRIDGMTETEVNRQWAFLLQQFKGRSSAHVLEMANALWAREGLRFNQPFLDADREYFGAQVATANFEKTDLAAAINHWASENTHGMIRRVIGEPPRDAVLYLANAVYFKGDWVAPFTRESTEKSAFTRADGSRVSVDMMRKTKRLPYAVTPTLQVTKLPYKGDAAAYYVLLPKLGVSIAQTLASLRGGGFAQLRESLNPESATDVALGLPKLDTDFQANLQASLVKMGVHRAFDSGRAQFSNMGDAGFPIYLGDVLHRTKVRIDEEGTEAAATLGLTFVLAAPGGEPVRMICDRPYVFAIVDEGTGTMLFLGMVNDPNE